MLPDPQTDTNELVADDFDSSLLSILFRHSAIGGIMADTDSVEYPPH